ncbi:MAG: hypothetical protein ABFS03_00945 [Chloroflexota bacterium]
MSLFSRKTFLDGDGFRQVDGFGLNDLVEVGTLGLVSDITGEEAAAEAAAIGTAANQAAEARLERQFQQTREDLLPFLQAGTGQLGTYQAGIGGSPLAPTLEGFEFDVNAALDSPSLAFQREFGEQQLDRLAGKNRQLGSGNRLYDVTRFGQGLASQSLADEYARQRDIFGTNQATQLKNYGLEADRFNQEMNRRAGLIDVGRGTGSALGGFGAGTASSVAGLLQDTGQLQGASALAGQQGLMNVLNMGTTALGGIYGGPAGAAAGSQLFSGGGGYGGYSPIGAQDAQGFF